MRIDETANIIERFRRKSHNGAGVRVGHCGCFVAVKDRSPGLQSTYMNTDTGSVKQ